MIDLSKSAGSLQIPSSSAMAVVDEVAEIPEQNAKHYHVLGRNVIFKYLSEISRLFQMAFFVVVARRFGPSELGSLTVLLAIGSGAGLLVGDLGINTTMIARISGRQKSERVKQASEALYWKNALCALAFVLMCGAMYFSRSSKSWTEILAVSVISVGAVWFEFLSALTNGVNRFDSEVWLRLSYRGVVYGGGALFALMGGLAGGLLYMATATIVILTVAFLMLSTRLIPVQISFHPVADLGLLRASLPVWVTQLAQLTYLKFDVVILGLLHVAALQTGWYAAAWKVADVLTSVPALLSAAALPLLCGDSAQRNIPLIAPRFLKMMYVLPFLFALPLAIGAGWITRLLYGAGFTETPRILRILVWSVVPLFVHYFLATVAVAVRRQSEAAILAATASILGMLAAVILVPRLGYEAMAVICLVANSLFACAMIYRFRDVTGSAQVGTGLKSLLSALGVFALCSHLPRDVHPILMIVAGTATYCLALLVLGVIRLRDVKRSWRLLGSVLWNRTSVEMGPA